LSEGIRCSLLLSSVFGIILGIGISAKSIKAVLIPIFRYLPGNAVMPRRTLPLADKEVQNAKPAPGQRIKAPFDGGGCIWRRTRLCAYKRRSLNFVNSLTRRMIGRSMQGTFLIRPSSPETGCGKPK
jgi:hypothetical protein